MLASGTTVESPSMMTSTDLTQAIVEQHVAEKTIEEDLPQLHTSTTVASATDVEAKVRAYFADAPIMQKIAYCESRFRQHDAAGNVLRGVVNSADVGVMQINEFYHLSTANKLGYDIETLEGNLDYGRYLYETQGTAPWIHSKPCWGPTAQVAVTE